MDGNQNHGYLQEDPSYDDLMSNAGWPGSGDPYSYPPAQAPQDQFPRYSSNQPSFDQYNLSQQTFVPSTFSNSPYATQYQHARPSDVFGPTSYNVDPSLPAFHGSDPSFSYNPQENVTISPHSLQYGPLANQQVNRGALASNFQLAANFNQRSQVQPTNFHNAQSSNMPSATHSQQYSALPDVSSEYLSKQPVKSKNFDIVIPAQSPQPTPIPTLKAEAEVVVDVPVRVTRPDLLAAKNKTAQSSLAHAPWVVVDDTPVQTPHALKS